VAQDLVIEDERTGGQAGADEGEACDSQGPFQLPPDQRADDAIGHKESPVGGADDANRQGHVPHILEGHGDKEEDQKRDTLQVSCDSKGFQHTAAFWYSSPGSFNGKGPVETRPMGRAMSSSVTIEPTALDGVSYVTRTVHGDERGSFCELWNQEQFERAGWKGTFLQDCLSRSRKGVLRGLHIQSPAQSKLITLLEGRTIHAAVDLRPASSSFGRHILCPLTAEEPRALLIEEGFAHGFLALEDCLMLYKCSELHAPQSEWSLKWDDPELAIDWPLTDTPVISLRDEAGLSLADFAALG